MAVVSTLQNMGRRTLARFIMIAIGVVALAAVGLGAWAWYAGRTSTEISEERALRAYRRAGGEETPREGVPKPGVYTYDQAGSESGGIGPASISRRLPGEARYVVTLEPGGYSAELALAAEHIEVVRFRLDGGDVRAVWRRTDITFVGVGRDDRRDLVPPPLERPGALAVGRRWNNTYRAGDLPVTSLSRVLRREAITVDGRTLSALVIRTVGDTGGAHPGTRIDTVWWSQALSLPLRWRIDMEVSGVARITTRTDLRLGSTIPTV